MLISDAVAQEFTEIAGEAGAVGPDPALLNIGLIFLLFVLFYVLMIRPQNKRMKEQKAMLDALQKGDRVLTAGGLIGIIVKVSDREVDIELSKGMVVTALRYTIQEKMDIAKAPTNDNATKAKPAVAAAKAVTAKKPVAKKTTARKTTPVKK